jgi:hypothetical protein
MQAPADIAQGNRNCLVMLTKVSIHSAQRGIFWHSWPLETQKPALYPIESAIGRLWPVHPKSAPNRS